MSAVVARPLACCSSPDRVANRAVDSNHRWARPAPRTAIGNAHVGVGIARRRSVASSDAAGRGGTGTGAPPVVLSGGTGSGADRAATEGLRNVAEALFVAASVPHGPNAMIIEPVTPYARLRRAPHPFGRKALSAHQLVTVGVTGKTPETLLRRGARTYEPRGGSRSGDGAMTCRKHVGTWVRRHVDRFAAGPGSAKLLAGPDRHASDALVRPRHLPIGAGEV